jgi:hypothetical protein
MCTCVGIAMRSSDGLSADGTWAWVVLEVKSLGELSRIALGGYSELDELCNLFPLF